MADLHGRTTVSKRTAAGIVDAGPWGEGVERVQYYLTERTLGHQL